MPPEFRYARPLKDIMHLGRLLCIIRINQILVDVVDVDNLKYRKKFDMLSPTFRRPRDGLNFRSSSMTLQCPLCAALKSAVEPSFQQAIKKKHSLIKTTSAIITTFIVQIILI